MARLSYFGDCVFATIATATLLGLAAGAPTTATTPTPTSVRIMPMPMTMSSMYSCMGNGMMGGGGGGMGGGMMSSTMGMQAHTYTSSVAMPTCTALYNATGACGGLGDQAGQRACMCDQQFFDWIYDCESEVHMCMNGHMMDGADAPHDDDGFHTMASQWHSLCDGYVTAAPTTPIVTALAADVTQPSSAAARSTFFSSPASWILPVVVSGVLTLL